MTKKATRVMLKGTEGNEDYLIIARDSGFVLGFKALLAIGQDNGKWGCRLRMVAAPSDIPIAKTKANLKKMIDVFTGVDWHKRSEERFSTMMIKPLEWGISFPEKVQEAVEGGITELFDEIATQLGDVKFLNRKDAESFATEAFKTQLDEMHASYLKWKGETESEVSATPADVIDFPSADDGGQDV